MPAWCNCLRKIGMNTCNICPRKCGVSRIEKNVGVCRATKDMVIANISLHKWEEPCISGINGSGTIFFSGCNLKCIFCQNYEISQKIKGKVYSSDELAKQFILLQNMGAHNINLVSPTIYVNGIIDSIKKSKQMGLKIPIVYNSNGYENIETIKLLEGYIDVYLPDLKYYDDIIANRYSKVNNYFSVASLAIQEMYKQVGKVKLDNNGIIQKGVIIRHLILPGYIENTINILNWINANFENDIYISIMAQYFPTYLAKNDDIINRKITKKEYHLVEKHLFSLDIENGYIQELGEHEEEYVPDFNKYLSRG